MYQLYWTQAAATQADQDQGQTNLEIHKKNIGLSKPIDRLVSPTFHSSIQSLHLSLKAPETLLQAAVKS